MQPQTIPQSPNPQQPPASTPDGTSPSGPSEWRSILSTVGLFIAAPLIALFLTTFIFHPYEVDGPSMQPTLQDGDRLIVLKTGPTWAKLTGGDFIPKRGDIIVFHRAGLSNQPEYSKQLIKRVIGLPGERVVVRNGTVTVYNDRFPEGFQPDAEGDYSQAIVTTPGSADYLLGDDEIFVSGDNRPNSQDSRDFGPINSDDIVGTLELRIYPFNEFESF